MCRIGGQSGPDGPRRNVADERCGAPYLVVHPAEYGVELETSVRQALIESRILCAGGTPGDGRPVNTVPGVSGGSAPDLRGKRYRAVVKPNLKCVAFILRRDADAELVRWTTQAQGAGPYDLM